MHTKSESRPGLLVVVVVVVGGGGGGGGGRGDEVDTIRTTGERLKFARDYPSLVTN